MDDGCGIVFLVLLGLIALGLVIMAIIYIVVPASVITIGSLGTAGVATGIFVGVKNIGKVLIEAHQQDFEAQK